MVSDILGPVLGAASTNFVSKTYNRADVLGPPLGAVGHPGACFGCRIDVLCVESLESRRRPRSPDSVPGEEMDALREKTTEEMH